jgi:hypothetical protein
LAIATTCALISEMKNVFLLFCAFFFGHLLALLPLGATVASTEKFSWWRALDSRDVDETPVAMTEEWLVLVFLDPECPVANGYLPVLNSLAQSCREKGIRFVGVYPDPVLTGEHIRKHRQEFSIAFPVMQDHNGRLVRMAGAVCASEVTVFDGGGRVLYCGRIDDRVGEDGASRPAATRHDLQEVLDRLSSGETGPFPFHRGFGCFFPNPARP